MKKLLYLIVFGCLFLITTGCENWLSVNPKTRTEEGEMFSSEIGFKNALTGIYISMKQKSLYGQQLTMDFVENLAQHWKLSESPTQEYKYDDTSVETTISDIYSKLYNTIINIDKLLEFIDNGVLEGDMYSLIRGEALALRAYCHLDILRLWGPIPGQQNGDKILAYVRNVSKESQPLHTWADYLKFLEEDLNNAEQLLKGVEDRGMEDDFFDYRTNRMNYWAVLGLKARFYQWTQNKTEAAKYAKMVIACDKFRLQTKNDYVLMDYIASNEFLFALHAFDMETTAFMLFFRPGAFKQDEDKIKKDVFKSDIVDNRLVLWKTIVEERGSRHVLHKYLQVGVNPESLQQIPLLRLSEMYLIAIECSDKESEYKPLAEKFISERGISVYSIDNVENKNKFVADEYFKEFYGEGQHFYYYKRVNAETIQWTPIRGSEAVYVLPFPINEPK